jgi:hypothetical protein
MRKLTVNTYIGYITKVPKNRKTGVYEKQNHRFKTKFLSNLAATIIVLHWKYQVGNKSLICLHVSTSYVEL